MLPNGPGRDWFPRSGALVLQCREVSRGHGRKSDVRQHPEWASRESSLPSTRNFPPAGIIISFGKRLGEQTSYRGVYGVDSVSESCHSSNASGYFAEKIFDTGTAWFLLANFSLDGPSVRLYLVWPFYLISVGRQQRDELPNLLQSFCLDQRLVISCLDSRVCFGALAYRDIARLDFRNVIFVRHLMFRLILPRKARASCRGQRVT